MRVTHIRVLVVLSFVLLLGSYIAPQFVVSNDPDVARLMRYDGYHAFVNANAFYVLPLLVVLAASVGTVFLQNWGRYLYLAWVAYSVGMSFAYGYRVSSPLDGFLGAVGFILDGAILAGAFLSSLATQFDNARP